MSLDHRMHGLVIDVTKPIRQTISMVARPDTASGRVCILVEAGVMGRDQIYIDPDDARAFASQLSWAAGETAAHADGGSDGTTTQDHDEAKVTCEKESNDEASSGSSS